MEKLRDELQLFNLMKDGSGSGLLNDEHMVNTQKLFQRIGELEDLVHECKNQSQPQELLDLRETIGRQSN